MGWTTKYIWGSIYSRCEVPYIFGGWRSINNEYVWDSHTFTEQCFDPYGFPCRNLGSVRNLGFVAYLWSFSSIDVGFCIPSKAVGWQFHKIPREKSTGWVETNPAMSFGMGLSITSTAKNLWFFAGYLADWPCPSEPSLGILEGFLSAFWDIFVSCRKTKISGTRYEVSYLVGGLEHEFYFSIGKFIIPTDFHMFQRGWNHQPAICACSFRLEWLGNCNCSGFIPSGSAVPTFTKWTQFTIAMDDISQLLACTLKWYTGWTIPFHMWHIPRISRWHTTIVHG